MTAYKDRMYKIRQNVYKAEEMTVYKYRMYKKTERIQGGGDNCIQGGGELHTKTKRR